MKVDFRKHPTQENCFVECFHGSPRGKPLKKRGHIFNFSSKSIQVSKTLSWHRPLTFTEKGRVRGDVKFSNSDAIFLELYSEAAYSYVGKSEILRRFTMWIDDLSGSQHKYPNISLEVSTYDDGPDEPTFGIGLYIEREQFIQIKEDLYSGKFNFLKVSFSTAFDYDLVFSSGSIVNYPSPHCLEALELDPKLYGKVITPYPYKILPSNFWQFDGAIKSYNGEPITEFDVTFGKIICSTPNEELLDPNIQRIREWMTHELLTDYPTFPK